MCLKLNPFQEELTLRVDISNVRVDVPRKTKKYGSHARFSPALGLSSATMPLQLSGSQNLNTKPHKTKPHKTWSGPVFRVGGPPMADARPLATSLLVREDTKARTGQKKKDQERRAKSLGPRAKSQEGPRAKNQEGPSTRTGTEEESFAPRGQAGPRRAGGARACGSPRARARGGGVRGGGGGARGSPAASHPSPLHPRPPYTAAAVTSCPRARPRARREGRGG